MLSQDEGISMNKSLEVHDYKLSADQGLANAQWCYADCLFSGIGIETNFQVGIEYLRRAADQNLVLAQLRCVNLFRQGFHC
jgi:TPR repeat protein